MNKGFGSLEGGQPSSKENDFERIAGEVPLTSDDVLHYVNKRAEKIKDPDAREDVQAQLKDWGAGPDELLGLFLMKIAETKNLQEAKELALNKNPKEVLYQNEQLPLLALLTSKYGSEKGSARYQRMLKDIGVDRDIIFRGILKEEE
ncbi:TPA: hypothetical protein DHW58_01845 [Patescibacteria group bacterium]|uniref:Uncharacterized protein n=2 Tax=Bacteria division Kazan-3B-28 TaxID=1798534 RepID=A0A0G1X859_UNCK3|nr:MAG: hypothetical protein VE98_C0001G0492 [candidate division Kazan bacterium GW2011_GWA1_50_15]KKW25820.1 MAG: hypothetical protein VE99_C0001G0459 [candidate division Kazan bacterium GW2011_GWC1_52_13]KKW27166.1 MAG: hypothetical protein VF00_C0001G0101 [candidate division Kazan bacterium GW2011_GWB1_52_7]HCL47713.1 hypothetical protein [Patescibacteria group bacterium]HCR42454.1 hypothetical protein [Patescibacteria group bacterium]